MMKTAFVTGVTGQDGAYLAHSLLKSGYRVIGGVRRSSNSVLHRLVELGISNDVEIVNFDLTELANISSIIEKYSPDEFYNLAAQSFVGSSWSQPFYTSDVDAIGVLRLLESIRLRSPDTKFYQASTSEMFGASNEVPQSERTPFYPRSPYGVAKLYGHWITINYRESYNLFACSGILFNHESPLRGLEFVTRKITSQLAEIAQDKRDVLELGNLDARRDWGYAGDYVEGMRLMLQHDVADDYVLSTGRTSTVREFVELCATHLGFDLQWTGTGLQEAGIDKKSGRVLISINENFYRPAEVDILLGDSSKAKRALNWQPKCNLEKLAEMMVRADFDRVSRGTLSF